ncbi:MAG: 30S ribosomal protein S16 [Patescibacteria group bacterium]
MLKIRLSKFGAKNAPTYRIVVSEARSKRDGKNLDKLGFYNPTAPNPKKFSYDKEKYIAWIKKGAKPTKAVVDMIKGKYIFKKYEPKKEIVEKPKENENNS